MRRMSRGALALSALGVVLTCATPVFAASTADINEVLNLVNQQRAQAGLGTLQLQSQLAQAAQGYANQLASGIPFGHTGPDGSTPFSRMQAAGYRGTIMGENIARGFTTPQAVMTAWMNSPGHRANILEARYTQIGIGIAGDSWVQDFGSGGGGSAPPTQPVIPTPTPEAEPTPQPLNPAVSAVVPSSAAVGQPIAIQGQRLGSAGTVAFSGGVIGQPTSWTDREIDLAVPNGAQNGPLYVQTEHGTASSGFFYVLNTGSTSGPLLQKISPPSGPAGTQVIIYGQRFGGRPGSVTFGGVPGTVRYWSPSGYYVAAVVPANAQSGPVVVTRATDGQASNGMSFTVTGGAGPSDGQQPIPLNPPTNTPPPTNVTPVPVPRYGNWPTWWGNYPRIRRP